MNITILGTGAFGIALALAFHENKNHICMWTKIEEEKNLLEKERCYEKVLPGIKIPEDISITTDMEEALKKADLIVLSIPACFVKSVCTQMKTFLTGKEHFIIASKGLETASLLFLDEVLKREIKTDKIAVLSGPTFAIDMAKKYPIALSLASTSEETKKITKKALESPFVKIEEVEDVLATEICGSIKNVMALGSGILRGMNMPVSTEAMYLTDALKDIEKLILAFKGKEKIILSYAGIGDLFLTCTSEKSRNFQLGFLIGSGASKREIEAYQRKTTVEGVYTLESFYKLAKEKSIDLPVIQLLYEILFENKPKETFYKFLQNKK